ncbi:MAG: rod shape-determining protein [Deltaproteobacteria bacterium]|nr:rod shape-determining protein [Deltaproteobacteria bacterium]
MLRDFGRRQAELAIDLGTTNTRIGVPGRGLVLEMPSVVAVDQRNPSRRVVAVGEEAREMLGRTPEHIRACRPIRGTAFDDYGLVQELLDHALRTALHGKIPHRPSITIALSHGTEEVARRAIQDSARAIGAREVVLIPKGVAAAVGSELPIQEPLGTLLVDIGGGSSEVVLMSLGGLIDHEVVPVGGEKIDEAIKAWVGSACGVSIGDRTAESIKLRVARTPNQTDPGIVVTGRDNQTGIPREVRIDSLNLASAILPTLVPIIDGLQAVLARTTPELSSDVADHGIVLTGGGALFPGVVPLLRDATGLPVVLGENPQLATIAGVLDLQQIPDQLHRLAWR